MYDFHKDLLNELVKDWTVQQVDTYIAELEERVTMLHDWVKHVKIVRKKKMRKPVFDNGVRSGA